MTCERDLGRAHRPDMQVVHLGDAGALLQVGPHGSRVDARWYRAHRHRHAIAQQAPGAPNDKRADYQTGHSIEPIPAGEQDDKARNHDARRHGCIGCHMQVCPTNVEIALAARREQPSRNAIDENAGAGHHHHCDAGNRFGVQQSLNGFPANGAHGDEQKHRIKQCRQD